MLGQVSESSRASMLGPLAVPYGAPERAPRPLRARRSGLSRSGRPERRPSFPGRAACAPLVPTQNRPVEEATVAPRPATIAQLPHHP